MQKSSNDQAGQQKRLRLGELLLQTGLIDQKTLATALERQKTSRKRIGRVLMEMGVADDLMIARALAQQLKIPFVDVERKDIPKELISLVPSELAENFVLIPVERTTDGLVVAMSNPLEIYAVDDLRFITQLPIQIAVAPERAILAALEKYYPKTYLHRDVQNEPYIEEGLEVVKQALPEEEDLKNLKHLTEMPPVVRFTNAIIADAIRLRASDIHIEPQKSRVLIRYRVDGILREIMRTDRHVHASTVSRIKILSNMDISIRRKPQDGRAQVRYGGKMYDLRVSTIPTSYGEKVTIRVLDQSNANIGLMDLGLPENGIETFLQLLDRPQGIILVTGPTGSGKSSTLYACLNKLNSPAVNIVTVEDPIEYDIEGVNQVQINPAAGLTFASGLRSILRQDPDIVMVGEIRDDETASIALQAGQTGHLVLSTLHTNDAPSAVARLLDLGVQPFLLSASLIAVVAQRLARRICPHCKAGDPESPRLLKQLAPYVRSDADQTFWRGLGCEKCQYTGYLGRLGLFEIFALNPEIRALIAPGVNTAQLAEAAARSGFQTMTMDGVQKALQGLTTIEEVFRVAPFDAEGHTPVEPISERAMRSRRQTPEAPPSEGTDPQISQADPKKILVADDNVLVRKIVRNVLESEGYRVKTAGNGMDAYKLAIREKPDLIITDILMPEMDGLTLLRKLRSQLSTRYIPTIMLTAKEEGDAEVESIEAGASDYITKPVHARELVARVNRLLNAPAAEGQS